MQDGCWRLIDSAEGFDALLASLDARGVRESELQLMLRNVEFSFKGTVGKNVQSVDMIQLSDDRVEAETAKTSRPDCNLNKEGHSSAEGLPHSDKPATSLSFRVELGLDEEEKDNAYKRYRNFETWMWKECLDLEKLCAHKLGKKRSVQLLSICDKCLHSYFVAERHCPHCRALCNSMFMEKMKDTYSTPLHSVSSPMQTRLLKAQLALIEVSVLPKGLEPFWVESYRKAWGMKLHSSSSAEELLQVLTLLENAIKRDYISSNFETTSELLISFTSPGFASNNSSLPKIVPVLPWIPYTTAAVALRLMDLDSSIFYTFQQKIESQKNKEAEDFMTKSAATKNAGVKAVEAPHLVKYYHERRGHRGLGCSSLEQAQGSLIRGLPRINGRRNQKSVSGSRFRSNKRKQTAVSDTLNVLVNWSGQTEGETGHGHDPRSVRNRRKPARNAVEAVGGKEAAKDINYCDARTGLLTEWNEENGMGKQIEADKGAVPVDQ